MDFLEDSVRLLETKQTSKKEILEQKNLLSRWPKLESQFKNLEKYEIQIPISLKNEFENLQSQGETEYTGVVKNLSQSGKYSGNIWLSQIAGNMLNFFKTEVNKSG